MGGEDGGIGAQQSPKWMDAQWVKIARALDAIEKVWMPLMTGPLNMGQVSVACALGYLDLRHDARNWRGGRPTLTAWNDGFSKRPSMEATKSD